MGNAAQQIANMVDMLPENDQRLAYELVKNLFLRGILILQRLPHKKHRHLQRQRNILKMENMLQ